MNSPAYKTKNTRGHFHTKHRSHRHSRRSIKRARVILQFFKWIKRNPGKLIGILCACLLIYISVMFWRYYKVTLRNENHPLKIESKWLYTKAGRYIQRRAPGKWKIRRRQKKTIDGGFIKQMKRQPLNFIWTFYRTWNVNNLEPF